MRSIISARHARAILFSFVLGFTLTGPLGCGPIATIAGTLPSVIKLVSDAANVLDAIGDQADGMDGLSPEALGKIHAALEKARHAFQAVKEAAKTAQSVSDERYLDALADARKAYDEVIALCGKSGVPLETTEGPEFGRKTSGQGAGVVLVVPSFDRLKSDSL